MVMNVCFLPMLLLLILLRIVVAVGNGIVIMLVGVPECPMFPLAGYSTIVMMRHMVVIVGMNLRWMGMLRLFAFAFGALWCCRWI